MAPRKDKNHDEGIPSHNEGPAPPQNESDALNLSVLRKYDPEIIQIIHVAPYAVAYVYDPEGLSTGWEKTGVEGSLFIYQLCENIESSQRYKVMLLNRRGLDNFTIELTGEGQIDPTDELIMFTNETDGQTIIRGIWVFSEPDQSSTTFEPKIVSEILKQCSIQVTHGRAARAMALQRFEVENTPVETRPSDGPSGRQLSLSEIFGQPRNENEAWSAQDSFPEIDASTSHQMYQSLQPQYHVTQPSRAIPQANLLQQPFAQAAPPQHQLPPTLGAALGSQQQRLLGLFQNARVPTTR